MNPFSSETDDCFAVRQAARHISKLYERHLSKVGITPTQFSILSMLDRNPKATMVQLADALVMDRTTLVRILKPLLRDGLVVAPAEERLNRRLRLMLTEKGRERLEQATAHWHAAQANFELIFGREQAVHLRNELFRITRDVPSV
ncbi:MarR family winged helix-turn-helix transcriptional regulator [Burkholderia sp. Ac-20365]|uniref:MarR family winged helix-turn-helix transcriptional regulator n=1 Tax=Burkholderia sp. Ac-20365 TaxID=2703897 RepID=UPI00197B849A|nr:MarR family winged helix-turn-helix transcriptional regulator [Burkholderia sp. Ac-20365]MBN3761892.1 winged helix-turn-helix transcriptional regulator [Burkholderia sp. Ac-20365]